MDAAKERKLKTELAAQGDAPFVAIERFFDGNDDLGSIGCNLVEHPGVDAFREALVGLTRRPDVESVYAIISEVDPGEGCWPFTDTIVVVGKIAAKDLQALLEGLQPDEVGLAKGVRIPEAILKRHTAPMLIAWWD